jgi:hypothetical protein
MTAAARPDGTDRNARTRWRSLRLWVVLAALVVLAGLIVGAPAQAGTPLDPRSTSPNGTKALVLLLQQFHVTVNLTNALPGPITDVALVLSDRLTDDRRTALARWVSAGGTLVVADPDSELQPAAVVAESSVHQPVPGPCPALGRAKAIDTGGSLMLRSVPGATACFPAKPGADAYFLVDRPIDTGHVIGLAGAGLFTNDLLAHDDNSVLAVDVLAAGGSNPTVDLLLPSPVGAGNQSLASLIGAPVKLALVQLLVAFVILALWRARRLGQPVIESQPVQVAGSELVVAVGNLMARSQARDAAASVLRGGLRRWLTSRFGLPPGATINELADAGSLRSGLDREGLNQALTDRPLVSDADLIALAQSLEHIRQEVAHGRP